MRDSSERAIINLGAWLQTATGLYVRDWEQAHLNALTSDIFGFHAVQIGLPQISTLQANRLPYRWLTDKHIPPAAPDAVVDGGSQNGEGSAGNSGGASDEATSDQAI